MPVRLRSVAFACNDPASVAAFWGSLPARQAVEDAEGVLLDGDDTQLGLRFLPTSARRSEPSRMHIHLTSTSLEHQRTTVATAVVLGA